MDDTISHYSTSYRLYIDNVLVAGKGLRDRSREESSTRARDRESEGYGPQNWTPAIATNKPGNNDLSDDYVEVRCHDHCSALDDERSLNIVLGGVFNKTFFTCFIKKILDKAHLSLCRSIDDVYLYKIFS